ncbi:MAG: hypothetical protein H8D45_29095 [Bacteroidetes bacterium]|nr:hypothetical protein [Bacteroidota bacterium]
MQKGNNMFQNGTNWYIQAYNPVGLKYGNTTLIRVNITAHLIFGEFPYG